MDVDWEVEIGCHAPVIEAQWPGLIDLRTQPEGVKEISETIIFAPLEGILLALNSEGSPVWTSKCDVWEPSPEALACYIDMIPREEHLCADWTALEKFCRKLVERLTPGAQHLPLQEFGRSRAVFDAGESAEQTSINLVIRRALIGCRDRFAVTAYFSAQSSPTEDAKSAMRAALAAFSGGLLFGISLVP
jgi:hypothetical protein